ncbi:hypothetical protein EX30DRAFT_76596 [Ascodesmis nigricans]|uniref:Uncharacterized protein n=1 Tax=Ascodesmis nigricans TaxID=341454 RepID=A0A4S2MTI6_9PEZI|nr:hypothetical protein EX30DRAFT_76596 [Ascodesmis nigricans]
MQGFRNGDRGIHKYNGALRDATPRFGGVEVWRCGDGEMERETENFVMVFLVRVTVGGAVFIIL